jgi:hypothetical protein
VTALQLIAVCALGCRNAACEHILQETSLPMAEKRRARWTAAEIAFIEGTHDEPLADVADALGRTYYGTSKARSLVKRGLLK